jgi:hypothetical protein
MKSTKTDNSSNTSNTTYPGIFGLSRRVVFGGETKEIVQLFNWISKLTSSLVNKIKETNVGN